MLPLPLDIIDIDIVDDDGDDSALLDAYEDGNAGSGSDEDDEFIIDAMMTTETTSNLNKQTHEESNIQKHTFNTNIGLSPRTILILDTDTAKEGTGTRRAICLPANTTPQ
jgi:hypothetical protein